MEIPEYLHGLVHQAVCYESETAINRNHWAVILGLRPTLDGDHYCFLYGDNLQEGVAGFGKTVVEAMNDFDNAMYQEAPKPAKNPPRAERKPWPDSQWILPESVSEEG